jgi:MFS family permease
MEKRRYWVYAGLFALISINYMDRIALSVAAKPLSDEFGLSPIQLGYLLSSFLWTYVTLMIPMAWAADRFGAKPIIGLGMAIWSGATILTGLSGGAGSVLATRLVMGAGECTSYPAGSRVIREWAPRGERGFATAIMNSGSYAGPAISAIFVSWLVGLLGWRMSFIIAGTIGFVWLIPWITKFQRPEQANFLSEAERERILAERDATTETLSDKSGLAGLLSLLRSPTMLGLILAEGCATYCAYFYLTWLPNYLQTVKHLTIMKSGLFTAAPYAIAVVVSMTLAHFSDRLLNKQSLLKGQRRYAVAIALVTASVMLLAPYIENIWLILCLFSISLIGQSTAISLILALVNDLLRAPQNAAKAVALMTVGANCFGLAAPIVTGYVIAQTGSYDSAFFITGTLLVLGAFFILTMTRRPIDEVAVQSEYQSAPAV